MKNKKIPDRSKDSFRQMFDALVPSVEELDDKEVLDILSAAGINTDALFAKAHHSFQELAGRKYLSQGKNLPGELKEALVQLKPASPRERVELETGKARAAIRSIVENVKANMAAVVNPKWGSSAMQPAFRNKKELSKEDQQQLAEIQEDLDKDVASSEE